MSTATQIVLCLCFVLLLVGMAKIGEKLSRTSQCSFRADVPEDSDGPAMMVMCAQGNRIEIAVDSIASTIEAINTASPVLTITRPAGVTFVNTNHIELVEFTKIERGATN